jgi:hypothetical protein
VHDLSVEQIVVSLDVGDLQRADGLDRHHKGFVSLTAAFLPDRVARRPEGAENLRPIESLSFAMLTEAHVSFLASLE